MQNYRKSLFPAGVGLLEGVVQHKSDTGQVAKILQHGKQGKKDSHGRKHHRNHPGQDPVDPLHQNAIQPGRGVYRLKKLGELYLSPGKPLAQEGGGQVGPPNGEPQHGGKQKHHHRDAGSAAGKQFVQPAVPAGIVGPAVLNDQGGQLLRQLYFLLYRPFWSRRAVCPSGHSGNDGGKRLQPFPLSRRCGHHRDPQAPGKGQMIHMDPLFFCLIYQVQANHHPTHQLHGLKDQVQIPLQAGGVAHHYDRVGPASEEKVPGDLLLRRPGCHGIGARQIHQYVLVAVIGIGAAGQLHRLTRPVSGMLVQARQAIEHRAFSYVWIAHQGNDLLHCPLLPS